jgi:hypothetical protein
MANVSEGTQMDVIPGNYGFSVTDLARALVECLVVCAAALALVAEMAVLVP